MEFWEVECEKVWKMCVHLRIFTTTRGENNVVICAADTINWLQVQSLGC